MWQTTSHGFQKEACFLRVFTAWRCAELEAKLPHWSNSGRNSVGADDALLLVGDGNSSSSSSSSSGIAAAPSSLSSSSERVVPRESSWPWNRNGWESERERERGSRGWKKAEGGRAGRISDWPWAAQKCEATTSATPTPTRSTAPAPSGKDGTREAGSKFIIIILYSIDYLFDIWARP